MITMMRSPSIRLTKLFVAAALLTAGLFAALLILTRCELPVFAQNAVPEIAFDSAPNPLAVPNEIPLGENAGIATDSKGDIFVLTRTGHPTLTMGTARPFAHGGTRLLEFDRTGKFMREIGQDSYGFVVGQQVRVDPQDNVWTVDQFTNMIIKWNPSGRVALLLGRKAESERIPNPAPAGGRGGEQAAANPEGGGGGANRGLPGAGAQADLFNRPTDVAWDAAGNIYISDGFGNARVAKFSKEGVFIKSWGSRGAEQGQFNQPHGIAIDAAGNVYVADNGNKRIQVFDGDGKFKTQYTDVGAPFALCITPGSHQYLYSSNSNPPLDYDTGGEIYKMELDGTVLGKFGKAGKLPKEFGTVNAIDCRGGNSLYVAELINWRVQKLSLHAK